MSCTVGIQRLYESQTHGVAGHSSTNEGNPSCASTASKKQYMRDTLITSIHMRAPFNALIALSAEAQMPHARLPFPIKTCLYKVCAHQQHHKHFCNSSPCKPSPQQTQPSSTMFRGKRLRSRTPRRSRSSGGECLFCSEPIAEQDKWVCFVCPVQAHKRCEEHWRRTANASGGCPQCRTTKTEIVREHELIPASKGTLCFFCRKVIREGDLHDMCLGGRDWCEAHWHPECALRWTRSPYNPSLATPTSSLTQIKCPACGLSKWDALNKRRS